jgi:molybdopterin-guanine dinucleotide biosynthesis protein A
VFDAIVLAGGGATRLGGADKASIKVGGAALLDRVVDAASAAASIIVVGPRRDVTTDMTTQVQWCREDPIGAGPVAAIATGLEHVRQQVTLLLAADLPWIAGAVDPLVNALEAQSGNVAVLVDATGRINFLAAAWRTPALRRALQAVGDPNGAAVRGLYSDVEAITISDDAGWATDCDTWDDIERARSAALDWRHR